VCIFGFLHQELLLLLLEQFGVALRLIKPAKSVADDEPRSRGHSKRKYLNKTARTARIDSLVDSSWQNMLQLQAQEDETESRLRGERIIIPLLLSEEHLPLNKFGWRPERYLMKIELQERGASCTSSPRPPSPIRCLSRSAQIRKYLPLFPYTPYAVSPESPDLPTPGSPAETAAAASRTLGLPYLYVPAYPPQKPPSPSSSSSSSSLAHKQGYQQEENHTMMEQAPSPQSSIHLLAPSATLTSPLTPESVSTLSPSSQLPSLLLRPPRPYEEAVTKTTPVENRPDPLLPASASLSIPRYGVVHELQRCYRFEYMPPGFFSRLMVHLLQVVDSPLYWKHGIVLLQTNSPNGEALNKSRGNSASSRSPLAPRKMSPTFLLASVKALSISAEQEELRRSGLNFDLIYNASRPRRISGHSPAWTSARKESEAKSQKASIRTRSDSKRNGGVKNEQRALLVEVPESSTLKVHVYGSNPGKLLRLIEVWPPCPSTIAAINLLSPFKANIEDLAINWFRVKTQTFVPCCHCLALRRNPMTKTTLYATEQLKKSNQRKAWIPHHDPTTADSPEPWLFPLEECLRAITKRRRVVYCQFGEASSSQTNLAKHR